jgi:hypothetical protein
LANISNQIKTTMKFVVPHHYHFKTQMLIYIRDRITSEIKNNNDDDSIEKVKLMWE